MHCFRRKYVDVFNFGCKPTHLLGTLKKGLRCFISQSKPLLCKFFFLVILFVSVGMKLSLVNLRCPNVPLPVADAVHVQHLCTIRNKSVK